MQMSYAIRNAYREVLRTPPWGNRNNLYKCLRHLTRHLSPLGFPTFDIPIPTCTIYVYIWYIYVKRPKKIVVIPPRRQFNKSYARLMTQFATDDVTQGVRRKGDAFSWEIEKLLPR